MREAIGARPRDLSLRMFEELEVLNRGFLRLKCSLCVRGYLNVLWEEGQNLIFQFQGRTSDVYSSVNSQMVSLCSSLSCWDVQGQPGS